MDSYEKITTSEPTNRRNYLRVSGMAVAAALAGCTGGELDGENEDDPETESTSEEESKRIVGRWPMADFGPAHTGYASDERGPESSPTSLWSMGFGSDLRLNAGGVRGAPAISEGVLYIGGPGGDVVSINATTGEEIWRNSTNFYIESSVAIGDEQLFVGAGDNHVHAFDLETGDRNWKRNMNSSVDSSVIYTQDLVIAYPEYGSLAALDSEYGEVVWEYDDGLSLTPSVKDGKIYVPTSDSDCDIWGSCTYSSGLDIVDVETGEKTGSIELPDEPSPTSTPTIDDHQLYLTAEEGRVYAASLDAREMVWEAKMEDAVRVVPTVANHLFTGDQSGTVYAFDKDTGDEVFTFDAGSSVTGLAVTSDTLYVGAQRNTSFGFLHALDRESGENPWTYEMDKPATNSPVIVDGAVFIGDSTGTLHTLVQESTKGKFESSGDT